MNDRCLQPAARGTHSSLHNALHVLRSMAPNARPALSLVRIWRHLQVDATLVVELTVALLPHRSEHHRLFQSPAHGVRRSTSTHSHNGASEAGEAPTGKFCSFPQLSRSSRSACLIRCCCSVRFTGTGTAPGSSSKVGSFTACVLGLLLYRRPTFDSILAMRGIVDMMVSPEQTYQPVDKGVCALTFRGLWRCNTGTAENGSRAREKNG